MLGQESLAYDPELTPLHRKIEMTNHKFVTLNYISKALHDRIGSRSNDDLDHILGKKDRNWLNF